MKKIIHVAGCDDSTEVAGDFTDAELALLEKVAAAITEAADYGCKPTMSIDGWHEPDEDDEPIVQVAAR